MKVGSLLVFTLVSCLLAVAVQAGDHATPDEAKAMAIKAAQYLKDAGPDTAFAAFNDKAGSWHDRDLYVFVNDASCKTFAHGGNQALVGKSLATLKDVEGKPFMLEIAAIKDAGWVDYKWQNPLTKAIEAKTTYVVRVGEFSLGVGAYK
jgi:cytochrome c